MAAIKQHAIVEKKACDGISPYSCLGLVMSHMCCDEMKNILSNTRVSPLGSKGYIIRSRCHKELMWCYEVT